MSTNSSGGSPEGPAAREAILTRWLPLGISCFAVLLAGVSTKIAHDDRARDVRYAVRAQVRNVTKGEDLFGLVSNAERGQVLEYRARLHNWGNVDARGVTLQVTQPSLSAGSVMRGTCRIRVPNKDDYAKCSDAMTERQLRLSVLEPDQTMEVTFRFRTRTAPCDGFKASTVFTARSADRTAIADTATARIARRQDGLECGSSDARLMELVPLAYRDRCKLSGYNEVVGSAAAHIECPAPGGNIEALSYYLYDTEQRANQVYLRRVRNVTADRLRQCARAPDGEGFQAYRGRSRQELRYMCWHQNGESIIELVNRRYKLYVTAYREDGGLRQLFSWINSHTP